MSNTLRIFRSGLLVGQQDFSLFWNWKTWLGGWMFRMFCTAVTWVLLGKALGSPEQLHFLLIGMAVLQRTAATGWTVAAATWDRYEGVYPLLVVSPSSLVPSIVGRTFIWLLNGIASSLVTFVLLIAIFGLPMPLPGTLFFPLVVALICASYYAFALFLGSLTIRLPQVRNIVHGIGQTILMTFCGGGVPVSFWSPRIAWIATILPVTHGLYALRLLFNRGPAGEILHGIALEILVSSVWLALGFITVDRMADHGRSDGSIDFV